MFVLLPKNLARDDCCIGGFSPAGPNGYCNPITALLAFVPPRPQVALVRMQSAGHESESASGTRALKKIKMTVQIDRKMDI